MCSTRLSHRCLCRSEKAVMTTLSRRFSLLFNAAVWGSGQELENEKNLNVFSIVTSLTRPLEPAPHLCSRLQA